MDEASVPMDRVRFERSVEARYMGQGHEVDVPLGGLAFDASLIETLAKRFDERHAVRYGHEMASGRETVTFRLRAFGTMPKLSITEIATGGEDATAALRETRSVHLAGERRECGVYDRTKLLAGNVIAGPAIIEEPAHVSVIFPGDTLRVDRFGNLVVTIGG
jgi:N-methylhydantoinase A